MQREPRRRRQRLRQQPQQQRRRQQQQQNDSTGSWRSWHSAWPTRSQRRYRVQGCSSSNSKYCSRARWVSINTAERKSHRQAAIAAKHRFIVRCPVCRPRYRNCNLLVAEQQLSSCRQVSGPHFSDTWLQLAGPP
mmetsp:Transcript_40038/g.115786  ORF Transcript_40038/g.115786 Transcript_40038/m.115786 type:complete len:135 (+) Transcript_40038:190-594(+)